MSEIERVVINTDARDILAQNGLMDGDSDGRVMIRDRKPEICGDFVSMNLVLADDVEAVHSEAYVMTHTTNPLLKPSTIKEGIRQFEAARGLGTADSLFAVNRIQTRFYRENGSAVNHDPNNLIRTQDLEPWFEENSNLYIFDRSSFATTGARIGSKPTMLVTPPLESVDIDDSDQWRMAESLALYAQQHQGDAINA